MKYFRKYVFSREFGCLFEWVKWVLRCFNYTMLAEIFTISTHLLVLYHVKKHVIFHLYLKWIFN